MTLNDISATNYKKCFICKDGRKNDCLHWHEDPESGEIWVYCVGRCQRGYSIYEYCHLAGISLKDFLQLNIKFQEATPNQVNKMEWPKSFIPFFHKEAKPGIDYLLSRGLHPSDNMFYDSAREGIVFPYYFEDSFVGAQIRFLEPRINEDGDPWKITTLPNTRLGNLFYNWNQKAFLSNVKYIVVTEGAFNTLSLQQVLNLKYGEILKNPYRCIALSGSGVSQHHIDVLSSLIKDGYKVIAAPDTDEAGLKMLNKLYTNSACTHFAMVEEEGVDWNDMLQKIGDDLAGYFASQIKKI